LKKLVIQAQQHDPDAFAELINMYKQDMYRIARSYLSNDEDVADAMQETILACFEKLPTLQKPMYFKTWLIKVLINKCNDRLRAGKRYVTMENLPEEGAEDMALANVEFMLLMDSLEEKFRAVFVLYYSEGFSVREISEHLNLTESAVKARLKRGREKIKNSYEFRKAGVLVC
jgi:RNA polymerase sigma-70 factor (ECF subfamily)